MTQDQALEELLGEPVSRSQRVGGGDIAIALQVWTRSGERVFVKLASEQRDPAWVRAEAEGLEALSRGGCVVPRVLAQSPQGLALAWWDRGRDSPRYQAALGRGLAAQHQLTQDAHGWLGGDNFIGRTPQRNAPDADGVRFFAEQRLGVLHRALAARGELTGADDRCLERLRGRLGEWLELPEERPALLHGDLWSGNSFPGPQGEALIFDPAVYYGYREADLAMTLLFGGFSQDFYAAYREVSPLTPGFRERAPLFNLYHLLNHALLFGGGYLQQALQTARRYAG